VEAIRVWKFNNSFLNPLTLALSREGRRDFRMKIK
jgi:hypothetical protein